MDVHRSSRFSLLLIVILQILKHSSQFGNSVQISQFPYLVTGGLPCGYYQMEPKQLVQIQSSNYGVSNYPNSDSCEWRFSGDGCAVNVRCPCFDIPASFQCLGDYLKFTDTVVYNQRFCGEVQPQGAYRTVSGLFKIRFKTDVRRVGRGFLCYIACTEPGKNDPVLPINTNNDPQLCFKPAPLLTTTPPTSTTSAGTTSTTSSTSTNAASVGMESTLMPVTPTLGPIIITPSTIPTFKMPPGCQWWLKQRQIPVGETIRESKPTQGQNQNIPAGIPPPWVCWPAYGKQKALDLLGVPKNTE